MTTKLKHQLIMIGSGAGVLGISFGVVATISSVSTISRYVDYFDATKGYSYESYKPNSDKDPVTTRWNMDTDESVVSNHFTYNDSDLPSQTDINAKKKFVRQIIDGSGHNVMDRSFNQSTFQGMINWSNNSDTSSEPDPNNSWANQDVPINGDPNNYGNYSKPSSDTTPGFENAYNSAIRSGDKILTLPGYLHASPLFDYMVHQTSSFDQAGYIFLDFDANYFQSASASANHIASVTFRADQSAFFAGLAACQYLNDNFDSYWTPSHPLSIGTFGGQPIPTVTCYMGGIELAAYVFNTTIENYATQDTPNFPYNNDPSSVAYYKKHQVNIINLGKPTSWFSNSFSIGDGKLLAQTLLELGADVIMPVAGPQTIDTVQEIKNQRSKTVVIGVDTPQENSDVNTTSCFTDKSGDNQIIKFSAIKNITYMVSAISWLNTKNQQQYGQGDAKVGSFGYLTVGDMNNYGAAASDNSIPYLKTFLNSIPNIQVNTWSDIVNTVSDQTKLSIVDPVDQTTYSWGRFIDRHEWFKC